MLAMFTIALPGCMCRNAYLMKKNAPSRSTPRILFHSLPVNCSSGLNDIRPALFTTTSRCPKRWRVPLTVASTCDSMETSHTLVQTSAAPACVVVAAASFKRASCKSTSVNRAPSCPSRFAAARPMPLAAPVTMATLFSYRRMDEFLFGILWRFGSSTAESPCLAAFFLRPFVAMLTGQDDRYLQAHALCRQDRAPGFDQRLVGRPDRPDVTFEI